MPVTMLGKDTLLTLLRGNGRVTLANRASDGTSLVILAAAIIRHDTAGVSSRQAVWELDLGPGEAQSLDPSIAADQNFAALEILFRLFSPDKRGFREVYLASPPDAVPARQWEVGVRSDTTPAIAGEFSVPESPGLVAYIRSTT
jgi:hypothetical protein